MKCSNCGYDAKDAKICPNCGAKISFFRMALYRTRSFKKAGLSVGLSFLLLFFSACNGSGNGLTSSSSSSTLPSSSQTSTPASSEVSQNPADYFKRISGNGKNLLKYKTKEEPSGKALFIMELKNISNKQLSFDPVSIIVKSPDGNELGTIENVYMRPAVVNPGESSFLCEDVASKLRATLDKKSLSLDEIGSAEAAMTWDVDTNVPKSNADVDDLKFSTGDAGELRVSGKINPHGESLNTAYVIIPIRDKSNKVRTVLMNKVDNISRSGKTPFNGFDLNDVKGLDPNSISANHIYVCNTQRAFGTNTVG